MKRRVERKRHFFTLDMIVLWIVVISLQLGCYLVQLNRLKQYAFMVVTVVICILYLHNKKTLLIPEVLYKVLLWLFYCFILGCLCLPVILGYKPKYDRLAYEFLGVSIGMVILVVGYSISRYGGSRYFLKAFSYFTSMLFILSFPLSMAGFKEVFYFFDIRYSGISGNPNDYMAIAYIALAYFLNCKNEKRWVRLMFAGIIVASVLFSGSRSGIVVLGLYLFIFFIEHFFTESEKYKKAFYFIAIGGVCFSVASILILLPFLKPFLEQLAQEIPPFRRIVFFLYNFNDSIGSGGSMRIQAWLGAAKLFLISPIFGIGIGGTKTILNHIDYPYYQLAPHNIYLEFLFQSGIIIFIIVAKAIAGCINKSYRFSDNNVTILRNIMFLFFLNGLTTPADWFVIFWFISGMFLGSLYKCEFERRGRYADDRGKGGCICDG